MSQRRASPHPGRWQSSDNATVRRGFRVHGAIHSVGGDPLPRFRLSGRFHGGGGLGAAGQVERVRRAREEGCVTQRQLLWIKGMLRETAKEGIPVAFQFPPISDVEADVVQRFAQWLLDEAEEQ